jgi:hypothetical protein
MASLRENDSVIFFYNFRENKKIEGITSADFSE